MNAFVVTAIEVQIGMLAATFVAWLAAKLVA